MSQALPIYTDRILEVNKIYTTIIVDGSYYPVGEVFKLLNENNQVRASAKIIKAVETKFDLIGYDYLKNSASLQLQSWPNAASYFRERFKDYFSYDGPIQIVTFEVVSIIGFDTPLIESIQEEKEIGLPHEEELSGEVTEAAPVKYNVEG